MLYIPDTMFYMRERDESIEGDNPFKWVYKTTKDLFAGKRVVIFGLPGAFTPTCSNSQLPGYEKLYEDFQDAGVDEVWCTSVNDAFVMYQWGLAQGIKNIKLLPDGNGDFADKLGMLVDKSNLGFGKRSWRYAMIVNDLKIENLLEEPGYRSNCPDDPYGISAPENVLNYLKGEKYDI
jgi:peroxiredoxin